MALLPDTATAYYRQQQRVSLSTLTLARRLWAKLGRGDFDQAWRTLGPQLLVVVAAGQTAAVAQAVDYVPAVLGELNISADPVARVVSGSLVGVASDGRALAGLLYQPVVATRTALGAGVDLAGSLQRGGALLDEIVSTQVVDAGRAAESIASVVRPAVTGYVRMLNLPSCPRCVALAGRHYRFNAGFQRHPRCDCRHIPVSESVAGDLTTDPRAAVESGLVKGLSKADTQAIADGADPAKVINAHRGMSSEQVFGEKLKVTAEGTSRRAGNSTVPTNSGTPVRLRPESIYKLAGDDRAKALALLQKYGYIL
jgi:hypothetical protein